MYGLPVPADDGALIFVTVAFFEARVMVTVYWWLLNIVVWIVVVRVWSGSETGALTGTTVTALVTTTYDAVGGGATPPTQDVEPPSTTKLSGPVVATALIGM